MELHFPRDSDGNRVSRPGVDFLEGGSHPGAYLVRIVITEETKQDVSIDNRNYPALIFDSPEPHPLSFSFGALRACVGENSIYKEIDDVRRVVVRLVNRKKRTSKGRKQMNRKRQEE